MATAYMVVRNSSYQDADPNVVAVKGQRLGRIVSVRAEEPFGAAYTEVNDRNEYLFVVFAILGADVSSLQKYVQPYLLPDPDDDPGAMKMELARRWELRHDELFPGGPLKGNQGRQKAKKGRKHQDEATYPPNVYSVRTASAAGNERTNFEQKKREKGKVKTLRRIPIRRQSTDMDWADFRTFLEDKVTGQRETVDL